MGALQHAPSSRSARASTSQGRKNAARPIITPARAAALSAFQESAAVPSCGVAAECGSLMCGLLVGARPRESGGRCSSACACSRLPTPPLSSNDSAGYASWRRGTRACVRAYHHPCSVSPPFVSCQPTLSHTVYFWCPTERVESTQTGHGSARTNAAARR